MSKVRPLSSVGPERPDAAVRLARLALEIDELVDELAALQPREPLLLQIAVLHLALAVARLDDAKADIDDTARIDEWVAA